MDDIKLLTKNENELEILIEAVRVCSQDIGIKQKNKLSEYLEVGNDTWRKE